MWDRRAAGRSSASPMYQEAFDQDELPWGAVLKLDRAIQTDKNMSGSIKQLRYSREKRGCLGVLSTAGQLQVLETRKEYVEPGLTAELAESPELVEVRTSCDLEYAHFDENHKRKQDLRIVSFDWVNVGSNELQGRVIALRANGDFEILQMPGPTAHHVPEFIPWKAPHHGT